MPIYLRKSTEQPLRQCWCCFGKLVHQAALALPVLNSADVRADSVPPQPPYSCFRKALRKGTAGRVWRGWPTTPDV